MYKNGFPIAGRSLLSQKITFLKKKDIKPRRYWYHEVTIFSWFFYAKKGVRHEKMYILRFFIHIFHHAYRIGLGPFRDGHTL